VGKRDRSARRSRRGVELCAGAVLGVYAGVAQSAASIQYQYDPANNNLLSKTVDGIKTKYGNYDDKGNYQCIVEGIVAATDTSTGQCDFTAAASPDARVTTYSYDSRYFSKISEKREPSVYPGGQKVTTYTYDDFANITQIHIAGFQPDGTPVSRTTNFEYNGPLHQLSRSDGPRTGVADVTTLDYYPNEAAEGFNRGRLRKVIGPYGLVLRDDIQYTATGQVASETRLNGLALTYTYYPGNDRREMLTQAGGGETRVTRWTYIATGEVETVTVGEGTAEAQTVTFHYDDARRLDRITDGLGNYIQYTLDTEGNLEAESIYDASGALHRTLVQTFDAYNRVDTSGQAMDTASPENRDLNFAPDGTLDWEQDGRNVVTDYSYDALRRLTQVAQDQGGTGDPSTNDAVIIYDYDIADRLTQATDPNSGTTTYTYDDLGNLLSQSSPDTGLTTYQYDSAGNVIQRTDAKGQEYTYTYDALNRPLVVDGPGTDADISYTYDNENPTCANSLGRLCATGRGSQSVMVFSYSVFGDRRQTLQVVNTGPSGEEQALVQFGRAYDAAGREQVYAYPSGLLVLYQYDGAGQVQGVVAEYGTGPSTIFSASSYKPFGPLAQWGLGNGHVGIGEYDSAYRWVSLFSGQHAQDEFTYDGNGNIVAVTPYSGLEEYVYDRLNRLIEAAALDGFGTHIYTYDTNGNRTDQVNNLVPIEYEYEPASNRMKAIDGDPNAVELDANGNTTMLRGRTLTHTPDNRLAEVSQGGNWQARFRYNSAGERVRKVVPAPGAAGAYGAVHTRVYVYDGNARLMAEAGPTGQATREYIYLPDRPLAVLDRTPTSNELFLRADFDGDGTITGSDFLEWYLNHYVPADASKDVTGDGVMGQEDYDLIGACVTNQNCTAATYTRTLYYVHVDHLGTPRVLSDSAGTAVWYAAYDPFGGAQTVEDLDGDGTAVALNLRFPGQYFDAETGLHYNYFRYYDPQSGRYVTSDPIGLEGGLNTFLYVKGDPISFVDPRGLESPIGWRFPGNGSVIASLGAGGAFHMGLFGVSMESGVVAGGGEGCVYSTVCARLGPGLFLGGGATSSLGATNNQGHRNGTSHGLFVEGGGGIAAGASLSIAPQSATYGKGFGGAGMGLAFGYQVCRMTVFCPEDRSCPSGI